MDVVGSIPTWPTTKTYGVKQKVPNVRIVFDAKAWNGRDVGDNSCFWKPALLQKIYLDREGREVADVIFLERPDEISHGHFTEFMRDLNEKYFTVEFKVNH